MVASEERDVWRIADGARQVRRDALVVEAPLELRCAGEALTVLLRTPGDDLDLARGLLHAEGVLRPGEAERVRQLAADVVDVDLPLAEVRARWPARTLEPSSSCGTCGKQRLADLELVAAPIASDLALAAGRVVELPGRLRAAQRVFDATGGLHAAGLFGEDGALLVVREDVGRHNAVDKVIGWALRDGRLPLARAVLCVSGRLGFEIVQKAVVAGVPIVVAVSAPSTFAVDLGERFRVTLVGFVRDGRFNLYSHPARVRDGE